MRASLSDDVWVVAPETDNSGVSHSLSLNDPLRLREIDDRHFAVKGTPTDCVIMGVRHIISEHRPDLVLSGVNRGQNAAEDVELFRHGRRREGGDDPQHSSIALSQAYGPGNRDNPPWDTGRTLGPDLVRKILAAGIPKGSLVNINFPDCHVDAVQGVSVTAQGKRDQELLRIEPRFDGRSNPYYWIAFAAQRQTDAGGRHRSVGACGKPDFGDAAASRSHRSGLYDQAGRGAGLMSASIESTMRGR